MGRIKKVKAHYYSIFIFLGGGGGGGVLSRHQEKKIIEFKEEMRTKQFASEISRPF